MLNDMGGKAMKQKVYHGKLMAYIKKVENKNKIKVTFKSPSLKSLEVVW